MLRVQSKNQTRSRGSVYSKGSITCGEGNCVQHEWKLIGNFYQRDFL